MKRGLLFILLFALLAVSMSAQTVKRRNFVIGAGGGVGTFIGNEVMPSAKFNNLDWHLYGEFGRWIIPQLSVVTHAKMFSMHGQSSYFLNPLIHINSTYNSGETYANNSARQEFINNANASYVSPATGSQYFYHDIEGTCFSLDLRFTIDWTNIVHNAAQGYSYKFHHLTAIAFGEAVLLGTQYNHWTATRPDNVIQISPDCTRHNWEVMMSLSYILEYTINPRWVADLTFCWMTTRGTIDFSSYAHRYDEPIVNLDHMPNVTLGMRYVIPQKRGGHAYCPQQTKSPRRKHKKW